MKPEVVFGLESAAWPALLVDAGGHVLRANAAAAGTFGAALEGQSPALSAIWSPDNKGSVEQLFAGWEQAATAVASLQFRTVNGMANFTAAICAFNKDEDKWFVLQLLPINEPKSRPEIPAASAAATENKSAPDANSVLLKQKLDCALQLARTVSLDFNNALTSVLGHASLLLSKAEPGHPWRYSLMEVEKSAARAAEIANELAVFSQHEKQPRRVPPGNLNLVANRCVEFFRNKHGDKIGWQMQLDRGLFVARFDEAKMQQAVTKILENAVEAVNGNGRISVLSRNLELTEPTQDRNARLSAGTYVCMEIGDNGHGIDGETLPRIFEPFFTTKGKTHRGLGLALVYGIVTNHGGGVAVSSQPGAGASVRIYLPAERQLNYESSPTDQDLHGAETVLVVDDENLLLTMSETILSEYGYKVLTANSGQKALAILSRDESQVDLVVTDLVMPGMGGRELVERIRQLAPATRILCTSGYVMPTGKQTDTAYLQKPFTSHELLSKVKQVIVSEPDVS
jgi:signal transduction histidine kinase